MNAIEHGNCRITYAEKTEWLDKGGDIIDLIRKKNKSPRVKKKKIYFTYRITPERSVFTEEIVFNNNQIIFKEGEESNFLYYIVSGKLKIYSKGEFISALTPEDIFLGEMSFLGNNQRSATVKSAGKSTLIKVSRDEFLTVVKENPHYGIFLAKLLAQRLSRLRDMTVKLKSQKSL
ncbi:MAG: cyclic nucleotide-binding domain-containing protein [Spirochaetota bacterium]